MTDFIANLGRLLDPANLEEMTPENLHDRLQSLRETPVRNNDWPDVYDFNNYNAEERALIGNYPIRSTVQWNVPMSDESGAVDVRIPVFEVNTGDFATGCRVRFYMDADKEEFLRNPDDSLMLSAHCVIDGETVEKRGIDILPEEEQLEDDEARQMAQELFNALF